MSSMPSKLPKDKDWVIHIIHILEEENEGNKDDESSVPVSIFTVPKTLISTKHEAYIPQMVALGPYHHGRFELFEMERYKLISAKRTQKKFNNFKFHDLVNRIMEHDDCIRAYYHRFLDFDRETLAWIFAIDAAFLLEYLQPYTCREKQGNSLTRVSSMTGHLIDYTRRKSAHQAILRDIIMLENQIPLFLLREAHMFYKHENDIDPDEEFAMMLLGFCRDISPLQIRIDHHHKDECFRKSHLLELLYVMVTPKIRVGPDNNDEDNEKANCEEEIIGVFGRCFNSILWFIYYINSTTVIFLGKICRSTLLNLFWKIIRSLFNVKQKALEELLESTKHVTEEVSDVTDMDRTPLIEEISIPSVTELAEIGVRFCPSEGGLDTIKFDKCSGKLYLPVVDLDDNSEVVLRNLVAYEASVAPEAMELTRYTELINGMVDTEEDVKTLREAGIILNRLKSDKDVADLWNGMTKSVKMTKVPVLDKAIERVNKYYSDSLKVKLKMTFKKYVFSSWPALTFLAANLLILLSTLQAFCSVYTCSKWVSKLG